MSTRVIACLFLLGLVVPREAAAQAVAVTGTVTDPQGGVVVGASVTLSSAGAARPITARSNAEGAFSLSAPPGRYTLQIDSPGFVAWTQVVVVAAGLAPIQAKLQIAGVLEDVQVSGTSPYNLTKPIPTASRLGLCAARNAGQRRRRVRRRDSRSRHADADRSQVARAGHHLVGADGQRRQHPQRRAASPAPTR